MVRYILKRLAYMAVVLFITAVLIFTLMYLVPGDPALSILGEGATVEAVARVHEELGLDDPYLVRLGRFLGELLRFDFGVSYRSKQPVMGEILARYPITLKLAFGSIVIGLVIGVTAGVISAVKQYSALDRILTTFSLFGASAPSFWIAMVLILLFSIKLKLLPATGSYTPVHWIMPMFTLGLQNSASIMRMTRSSMLEVIRQDYIRTAKAKGQTEFKTIVFHGLRNAMIPILTTVGILLCDALGGSVLLESVFALPGLGKFVLDSVSFKDYPVVQGGVLWICINCIVLTFFVDILYAFVDPRIRSIYGRKKKKKIVLEGGMENG